MIRLGMLFCMLAMSALAQYRAVLPMLADGTGWQTRITIVNSSLFQSSGIRMQFFNANGVPLPMPIKGVGTVSEISRSIQQGGSFIFETEGTAASLSVGWILVTSGMLGGPARSWPFAMFRQSVAGRPDYEGAIFPIDEQTQQLVFAFDNIEPLITSLAVVNLAGFADNLVFTFREENGQIILQQSVNVPASGHLAFESTFRWPQTRGRRGSLSITTSAGNGKFAAGAFRFHSSGAFSTLPNFAYIP